MQNSIDKSIIYMIAKVKILAFWTEFMLTI